VIISENAVIANVFYRELFLINWQNKEKITDFRDEDKMFVGLEQAVKKIPRQKQGQSEVVFLGEKRYFLFRHLTSLNRSLVLSILLVETNVPFKNFVSTSTLIVLFTAVFPVETIFQSESPVSFIAG